MNFEFYPRKSQTNNLKYGIDFEEAQRLWADDDRVEAPVRVTDEPRRISVGIIDGAYWTAVWTRRGEKICIISVRRSRRNEVGGYDSRRL